MGRWKIPDPPFWAIKFAKAGDGVARLGDAEITQVASHRQASGEWKFRHLGLGRQPWRAKFTSKPALSPDSEHNLLASLWCSLAEFLSYKAGVPAARA